MPTSDNPRSPRARDRPPSKRSRSDTDRLDEYYAGPLALSSTPQAGWPAAPEGRCEPVFRIGPIVIQFNGPPDERFRKRKLTKVKYRPIGVTSWNTEFAES